MAFSPPQELRPPFRRPAGFTLVEVTLALGIIAFAFVALLGLLPAGNVAFRRAIDLATCAQIAQRVIADAQNGDFNTLTKTGSTPTFIPGHTVRLNVRYFDEDGREIIPATANPTKEELRRAIYYVNTRVLQTAKLPRNADTRTRAADTSLGQQTPLNPMAQVTVQIVHNPNGLPLTISTSDPDDVTKPDRNLVLDTRDAKVQMDIFTYAAMVGRNN